MTNPTPRHPSRPARSPDEDTANAPLTSFDRDAWRLIARRAWHGYVRHRGIDSAAALTFFSALALFPSALSVVSALAIVDSKRGAVHDLLATVGSVAKDSTVGLLSEPLTQLTQLPNPGWGLAIGLALTIWTASGYATAFGRAVNTVYEVQEGRQFWKFRGSMIMVTIVTTLAFAVVVATLLGTPAVAEAIGDSVGIGQPWITVWSVLRWPILAILAVVIVGILYYSTPNLERPTLRWVSSGSVFAITVWALATAGFGLYVATVGQYDKIYGWLGGGIVLLLWLYITNTVLVIGAEVDAEIVRVRQLQSGVEAEETIRLPLRDTTRNLMLARHQAQDVADGRELRDSQVP